MKRTKGVTAYSRESQLQILSTALGRMSWANRLGLQYGGDRDVYEALGYPKTIPYDDFEKRYIRQDIAAGVIDRPVDGTWLGDIAVVDPDNDDSQLTKDWKELYKELKLKKRFVQVDKLSTIGRYSILVFGTNDITSKEVFAQEIAPGDKELKYVKVFNENQAQINSYVTDTKDERYGHPLNYTVQMESGESVVVHHSRVLHIMGKTLNSDIYGLPSMERVYNRFMDLEKIVGGSAEMFWRGARPGYQANIDKEYSMDPDQIEKLLDDFNEYEHHLRRILVNEGVEYKALESQVAKPKEHVEVQIQMISSGTNIPNRILLGSERGELASTQDRDNWFSYLDVRREEHAEPDIVRPFVDWCQEYGILAEQEEYGVVWSDLRTESDKDRVEIGKSRSTILKEYTQSIGAEDLIPMDVFFTKFLGFDEEEAEVIVNAIEKERRNNPPETPPTPEELELIDEEANAVQANLSGEDLTKLTYLGIMKDNGQLKRTK